MSLLEKLMEKKDLDTYLRLRIRRLKQELREIEKYPEKDRERIIKTIESRIKELSKLGDALRSNKIKDKCKNMWKHFNYPNSHFTVNKNHSQKKSSSGEKLDEMPDYETPNEVESSNDKLIHSSDTSQSDEKENKEGKRCS